MLELAAHTELFPEEDFVIEKDDKGNFPIYRLAEDDEHRFALYMSTSIGAKDVHPMTTPRGPSSSASRAPKRIDSTKRLATIPSRARGRSGSAVARPSVQALACALCQRMCTVFIPQRAAGAHPAHVRAGPRSSAEPRHV